MSKMKELVMEEQAVIEDPNLEQEFKLGDQVNVYDSRFSGRIKTGVVLYIKEDDDGFNILNVDIDGSLLQVSEIQCIRLKKRAPRTIYLKWNLETKKYEFSASKLKDYSKFVEEL